MLGAIIGDIIGSPYEKRPVKSMDFPLFGKRSGFTDDTVLTVAVADCLLHQKDFADTIRTYAKEYPFAGYGGTFISWMNEKITGPYNSWGNGSAMRVSPVGWAFDSMAEVLAAAEQSAAITHNHPEGIKGAQAVAAAVFMARTGVEKPVIKDWIEQTFDYNLSRSIAEIQPIYKFDVSCQGSVPEAIIAFLESESVLDAIRKAIFLGGDADTQAAIAGSIAEAYYGEILEELVEEGMKRLPESFIGLIEKFYKVYILK